MDIKHRNRLGQAMIELSVGLVSLIVITATIAQLAVFVRARHEAANRARRDAGARALQAWPLSAPGAYIGTTGEGPDGKPYTRDDIFTPADPAAFHRDILNTLAMPPTDWNAMDPIAENPFSRMRGGAPVISVFGLIRGDRSERIPLLPAIRNLLYAEDSILIEETVWMPWTRGVY